MPTPGDRGAGKLGGPGVGAGGDVGGRDGAVGAVTGCRRAVPGGKVFGRFTTGITEQPCIVLSKKNRGPPKGGKFLRTLNTSAANSGGHTSFACSRWSTSPRGDTRRIKIEHPSNVASKTPSAPSG